MSDLPKLSYLRPRDLEEAIAALARPRACIYAGGTDLLVALTERRPWVGFVRELVDIKNLAAARGLTDLGDRLRIGALVTAEELASSALVRREVPVLAEAAVLTSAPALRRRGTIGGNVTTPHPAGDLATALLALAGTVEVIDGNVVREMSLVEFMASHTREWPRQRLVLAVKVRKCRTSAFEKLGSRSSFSRSIVAVGVSTFGDGVILALGGMNDRPFTASAAAAAVEQGGAVGAALARECRPPADALAASCYRLRLAEALIARALARTGRP